MILLLLSALALAGEPVCHAPQAHRATPAPHLELGAGVSRRWAAYVIGSTMFGMDVPVRSWLSLTASATAHTSGTREIWVGPFDGRYLLSAGELGLRVRRERHTSRLAPVGTVGGYVIADVEVGVQADVGVEWWWDRAHRVGLRPVAGAAWSPERPLSPYTSVRWMVRLGR